MHQNSRRVPLALALVAIGGSTLKAAPRPYLMFVMADDMGWGHTGCRNHPVPKTPNLDGMAAGGFEVPSARHAGRRTDSARTIEREIRATGL